MKRTVIQMIAIIGFAACSAAYTHAQTTEVYRAEIPFDFSVGKKAYPAGSYRIEVRGPQQKYFVLRDANGLNAYIANSTPDSGREGARLDFQRVGESYFLTSVSASDRTSRFPSRSVDANLARNATPEKLTVMLSHGLPAKAER